MTHYQSFVSYDRVTACLLVKLLIILVGLSCSISFLILRTVMILTHD